MKSLRQKWTISTRRKKACGETAKTKSKSLMRRRHRSLRQAVLAEQDVKALHCDSRERSATCD